MSREARQQPARRVTCSYDEDGSLVIKASLPAQTRALFVKRWTPLQKRHGSASITDSQRGWSE